MSSCTGVPFKVDGECSFILVFILFYTKILLLLYKIALSRTRWNIILPHSQKQQALFIMLDMKRYMRTLLAFTVIYTIHFVFMKIPFHILPVLMSVCKCTYTQEDWIMQILTWLTSYNIICMDYCMELECFFITCTKFRRCRSNQGIQVPLRAFWDNWFLYYWYK